MSQYAHSVIQNFAKPVPRYTSYPTAPHFNESVQSQTVSKWMGLIPNDDAISVYIHIPFCDRLCWFCGCHTKHTLKYEPVKRYLQTLYKEIRLAAQKIGRKQPLAHLHLGGGSPSLLRAHELMELKAVLLECFTFKDETEISLEFDPTDLDEDALLAFTAFGVTRASLGVQDFDPLVQQTINRIQSFEQTQFVIETLRAYGVKSLNIDALYGLPHQTLKTLGDTLEQVEALSPDRIALFGYAHVPWVKTHQKLIPEDSLPDNVERFTQARFAEGFLKSAEFDAIGIDHFARSTDSLSIAYKGGKVRRDFQGYTTDQSNTLLGFGVSSISQFKQGYAQNVKDTHSYKRALEEGYLPTQRGYALASQDWLMSAAINELMCYFTLSPHALIQQFGASASDVIKRAEQIVTDDEYGFFIKTKGRFVITAEGRPFARTYAAKFDAYLASNEARYSVAV